MTYTLDKLTDALRRLPGIGPKSANRLAYHIIIKMPQEEVELISSAILNAKNQTILCEECMNISHESICNICKSLQRDRSVLCIVEEPIDLQALERISLYSGLYHVLHGRISPIDGIGPDDLKIKELKNRLQQQNSEFKEIILATNPNMVGETTSLYIYQQILAKLDCKVTKLAIGLPSGSDIDYTDAVTLAHALRMRTEFNKSSK